MGTLHRTILLLFWLGSWLLPAQSIPLNSVQALKLHNVSAEAVTYKGRQAIRVTEPAGQSSNREDKLAIVPGILFHNGQIEAELAGAPVAGASEAARGFVGIAFRVADDASRFECFYLRPTNGRADDQLRRNHSVQYISFPDFPWHRLRQETPGKYETYADLVPGEWTKVRIEVQGVKARLWVHDAAQPTLLVNDLKHGDSKGAIALWIGPGTEAHFTSLRMNK